MRCATFDRPEVEPVARACLAHAGVGDRCQAKSLNFFTEPSFPSGYDVITMGFILHDWGLPRKMMLMKKVGSMDQLLVLVMEWLVLCW